MCNFIITANVPLSLILTKFNINFDERNSEISYVDGPWKKTATGSPDVKYVRNSFVIKFYSL